MNFSCFAEERLASSFRMENSAARQNIPTMRFVQHPLFSIWSPLSFEPIRPPRLSPAAPSLYTFCGGERDPVIFPAFKAVLSVPQHGAPGHREISCVYAGSREVAARSTWHALALNRRSNSTAVAPAEAVEAGGPRWQLVTVSGGHLLAGPELSGPARCRSRVGLWPTASHS